MTLAHALLQCGANGHQGVDLAHLGHDRPGLDGEPLLLDLDTAVGSLTVACGLQDVTNRGVEHATGPLLQPPPCCSISPTAASFDESDGHIDDDQREVTSIDEIRESPF